MPRVSSHWSVQSPRFGSLAIQMFAPLVNSTDANQTISTAQLLSGLIDRSIGAARTDTLPAAGVLAEAMGSPMIGHSIMFFVRNVSSAANMLTLAVGAGGTADAKSTLTVAQNNVREFLLVFTSVTVGSEAYTLYSLGTSTT